MNEALAGGPAITGNPRRGRSSRQEAQEDAVVVARRRSVLVIDDDEDISCLIEALVTTRADYRFIDAISDPFDGAVRAAAEGPQVVIVGAHRSTFQPIDLIARLRRHDG